ncbi:MAG: TonB-dependent receptor, partial [Chitinophagaceae bacterium]|nr:TonB-dependent receptor [Chitinophagaceae bacterium]
MNIHTLIVLILFISWVPAFTQSSIITGRVTDIRKRPMQGVSVSIAGTYDGATSDSSGTFRFNTTEKGLQKLQASFTGFGMWEKELNLPGENLHFEIMLKEIPNELTAVVITAGSFEASSERKITVLKPLDIVTTASANADVAAALRTLPGTQQIGESAELFVRGGEGYETRQFIDGLTVPNPFFSSAPNIASRGRFSPFLFKGTVFSTGGYSALYGQALSSALVLESIDLPERSEASASVSPLFIGGQYQHLGKNKKSSWGGSAGYTDLGLYFAVVPQKPDYFKAPKVYNADVNFRIKTSSNGMLKFYAQYARNDLGLRTPDIDSLHLKDAFGISSHNLYTNLSLRERLSNRLKIKAGISLAYNSDKMEQELQDAENKPVESILPPYMQAKNYNLLNRGWLLQARAVFDYKLSGLSAIRWGAEYWHSIDSTQYNSFRTGLKDPYTALFAEGDVYITSKLAFRAGIRAEKSGLIDRSNIAPRGSLAYQFNKKAQLSADYGIFYQKPINQYLMFDRDMPFMRADHFIITYQRMDAVTTFRAQLFQKNYKQLPLFSNDTAANGTGFAQGFELFWRDKKTLKNFDYWVTYSWLNTEREYLNFPYSMQPSFAANHTANLVVKRFFTKMNTQLNLNYQYASGRPYYNIRWDEGTSKWAVLDKGKTIDFNSLSFSANYLTSIGKAFAVLVVSITNVLNSTQVYGYQYSRDGSNRVAIVPPAKQFFFVGAFLSWGADRRQDA